MTGNELTRRVLKRIGDDPDAGDALAHYTAPEVLVALNRCQRLFCFFSLCLEGQFTMTGFTVQIGFARYHMLDYVADWIAPLRIRAQGETTSLKLTPTRLDELAALDEHWGDSQGLTTRYALSGFDLLSLYKQSFVTLDFLYARGPAVLTSVSSPEIPLRYQPALIDGAVPLLRIKEGMQEWQKTMPFWSRFMDAVQDCADKVRARNKELGYDSLPVEIKRYDKSHILKAG